MKQKLYNLKMQILRDLSIKDDLKKDLAEKIFQIEKDLAINYSQCCTEDCKKTEHNKDIEVLGVCTYCFKKQEIK